VKHRLGILVIGTLGVWVLAIAPARAYLGDTGVVYSGVAALLCLLPNIGTLLWADRIANRGAEDQLLLLVGGTLMRMVVALGGGLALHLLVPYFEQMSFWVWLLFFYLLTLALDVFLIVTARSVRSDR